jgi:cytochrome c-type biogenesis protein CcmF
VAGAWWSYEVLGWGGYWAWDPVENAALLPWLTATAFIHSSMVAERRGTLRVWSHLLVVITFWLTLFGTFLTRSGVVASVHSFTASGIGGWFLGALVITLAAGTALIVWRLPDLGDRRPAGQPVSRESAFLFNNVLFLAISLTVLVGTLYPLAVEAVSDQKVSVGAPWFNRVGAPAFVALLFLMGIGPALPWGGASWATLRRRFAPPVVLALLAVGLAVLLGLREMAPLAAIGFAVFVLVVMVDEVARGAAARGRARGEPGAKATWRLMTHNRRRYGGYLVHAGICIMAVAIAISATLGTDVTATLSPGEEMTIGAYRLRHERLVVEPLSDDARVRETRAELTLSGPQSGAVTTALRDYPSSTTPIATPSVRSSLGEDLYVTLLAYDPDDESATLHVFVNPMVGWIWLGGAIVAAGAIFAVWPERRRRLPASAAATAAG